ncbi:MAG: Asp-tRNA(Asn)/Glu-tRNA(Gln) amidotransferase GatCAB subunit C [Thermotogae bacterium]|nr:Asp-tRNA(Asn)/Glu-tRNA(Gln) amidotransferase GatCAB subunit C [Thermotogota bacterium]
MEVRVLPPQLDVSRIAALARVEADDEMEEDLLKILDFIAILSRIPDDVEPMLSVVERAAPLREDEPGDTYPDIYALAPDTEGRFIRFISPIGRKT